MRVFQADGYICDPDEVPECEYCGKPHKRGHSIHATNTSGIFCCLSSICLRKHALTEWSRFTKKPE